jgi:hypothetical protein
MLHMASLLIVFLARFYACTKHRRMKNEGGLSQITKESEPLIKNCWRVKEYDERDVSSS